MSDETKDIDPEIVELERQLTEAQSANAEAEAKRARARRVATLKAEIAKETRERQETEALERLEAEHGPLGTEIERVDTLDGMVIVKRPPGIKVKRWRDKEKYHHEALREIARPQVVYPDLGTFDKMVEDRPVTIEHVANAVLRLGGLRLKELSGK